MPGLATIAARRRGILAGAIIALAASAIFSLPQVDRLRGLSIDILTWLRWSTFGPLHDPRSSPTVVVALDEATYNTPPFENTPTVTWTRELAKVINAVIDGGAKVIGLDVIFPNSIEQSEIPFGEETVGARLRGFDREYLRALASAARAGKIVLGQVQHQNAPLRPSEGQRVAVGHQRNIRVVNFHADSDEIVRRVPATFVVDGQTMPSFSAELAARWTDSTPVVGSDRNVSVAGRPAAGLVPNTFTLNFEGGPDDIPTYSLADMRACAEKGDTEFFRRHFEGRVVLIGVLLDLEDRTVASNRLTTGIEGAHAERCALPAPSSAGKFARDSVAGVYVHATAVNNLIRGVALIEQGRLKSAVVLLALCGLVSGLVLAFGAGTGGLIMGAVLIAWAVAATWAFRNGMVLPLMDALAATVLAFGTSTGYRAVVLNRDKRLLRRSFALYLPPAVVDTMLASNRPPELGGETRNVTMYFSDLARFSALAENLSPTELVAVMNTYLSAMTEIIEEHGGFVDKYIGDAVVAVFGAPIALPNHALSAVEAALACNARLDELNRNEAAFAGARLAQRIGLNSGPALIGNIGSRQRFNYTAMGDTVNLAARLEGANKAYGTSIIASRDTRDQVGPAILWRELDTVRVVGIATPVSIFEPVARLGGEVEARAAACAAYGEGLARWRAGDWTGAAEAFARYAASDTPTERFLERARKQAARPPSAGWEAINDLTEK